jgi:acyl-CoA synthetase (AMP-forming)/AMP-acid ligase II
VKLSNEGYVSTMVGCGYPARERPKDVSPVDVAIVLCDDSQEVVASDETSSSSSSSLSASTNPVGHMPAQGKRLGEGKVGEIWVRSPSVAKGYWGKETKSKEDFGATIEGEEGTFLRTGDQVVVHIYVCGFMEKLKYQKKKLKNRKCSQCLC